MGRGVVAWIEKRGVDRSELFLQTKFTFRAGQDDRLPYDPTAPIAQQVEQSFASSLEHLATNSIDSYLLHGPSARTELARDDWEAWRAMEAIHDSQRVRWLGVSNVSLRQLQQLCDGARIPPRFVQNRCYAITGWDQQVRAFCREREIVYQGFSLLTANRAIFGRAELAMIAERYRRDMAQIVFRFALDVGMICLTGTTDDKHMVMDLDVFSFGLKPDEIEQIEALAMH
ncbi:MAG: aldo/keto reductase [Planctomycetota bacterium]|nr:aldo/keto reductase [Planctomycetota bacterium]